MSSAIKDMEQEIADLEKGQANEAAQHEPPQQEPAQQAEPEPQQEGEPEEPQTAEQPPADPRYEKLSSALKEERDARKQAQERAENERREREREMAVLNDRLERLYAAQQQAAQPKETEEDFSDQPEHVREALKAGRPTVAFQDDPEKYLAQRDALEERRERYVRDVVERQQKQGEEQTQRAQLQAAIQTHEYRFVQDHPDYQQALNHLRQDRLNELMETGMAYPHASQIVLQDELWMAANAMRSGRNPAEVAYNLARRRGYADQQQAPTQPNGRAESMSPSETNEHARKMSTAETQQDQNFERMAAGQRESQSLGAVSGGGGGKLDAKALLNMSEEEFAEAEAKMTAQQRREVFGA